MEISNSDATNSDSASSSLASNGGGVARILQLPAIRFLQSPISSLLEYSGVLRLRPEYRYPESLSLIPESTSAGVNAQNSDNFESVNRNDSADGSGNSNSGNSSNSAEVSIRIIGDQDRAGGENGVNGVGLGVDESMVGADVNGNGAGSSTNDNNNNNRETSSYQRYDIQQAARWIEQILPFSLLLLVVFIRQHLQGNLL